MKRLNGIIPLLFAIFVVVNGVLIEDVRDQVIQDVEGAWKVLQGLETDASKPLAQTVKDLAQIVAPIPDKISKVERDLNEFEYEDALKSLGKVKNSSHSWRDKWSEIALLTSPVDILYGHFKIFPEMPEAFLPGSGYDFNVNSITDLILKPLYNNNIDSTGKPEQGGTLTLQYLIDHVHQSAVTKTRREKDAFHLLNDQIEESLHKSYWCLWNGKTPQRIVYGLYETLALYDVKEYTLLNFAWMLQFAINKTDTKSMTYDAKQILLERFEQKSVIAKDVMNKASSSFWKCDPIKYQEGTNYAEFKELLQGYIENENMMHPSGSCKQSCTDYEFVKARCQYPDDEECFKRRICTGNLVECKYIAADATACPADAPRRFDYIDYKRGPTLGSNSQPCHKSTVKKDSHWRFLYHCSNCFCLCDDPKSPTTVRHISLAPVTSDVSANKIVTGVRFVMKHGILQLQIEQGQPEKDGEINDSTTEWKQLKKLSKTDPSNVTILEYTRRNIDLDDLLVPKDHVVTGVKFRVLGSHINLEVQATQINPETANLVPGSSHWISNDNTPEAANRPRLKLHLEEADIPTKTKSPCVPDSVHDMFVKFGPTSRYKDVAQSTVPFIDLQEVRPSPPVWLRGVGIYHKGQPGYGGFLAPRLYTVSVPNFIRSGTGIASPQAN